MTVQNGVYQPRSESDFARVPPGAMFRNPKDGKLMRKKRER